MSSLSPSAEPARSRRACLGSILSIGEYKACVFRRGVQMPPGGSRNANNMCSDPVAPECLRPTGGCAMAPWPHARGNRIRRAGSERENVQIWPYASCTPSMWTRTCMCICVCVSIYICTYFALATAATALFEWPIWRRSAAERIVILPLALRLKRIVTRAAPSPTAAPTSPWDT